MDETLIVTMQWEQVTDPLLAEIARYVVMSRGAEGCRNVDLCSSVTVAGRVVIIEKWGSAAAQRAHMDGDAMVRLATAARDLGASRPALDLLEGMSAHDLT